MNDRRRRLAVTAPLVAGAALLAMTLARMEPLGDIHTLALLLPAALVPSAGWHLLRTIAWHECFPSDAQPSFGRTFWVRLAAEAFSFVTVRGVAGEPLKVVLLEDRVPPTISAA